MIFRRLDLRWLRWLRPAPARRWGDRIAWGAPGAVWGAAKGTVR